MAPVLLLTALLLTDPRPGFDWPLTGTPVVERRFDPPETDYGAGHRGVDLAADAGDEVLAAGAGTVTYAGVLAGRGVVAVTHAGGLRTTYEPVDAAVSLGDVVTTGEVLGRVATGHGSCRFATCLHWGLRRGDAYLDPLALVVGGPVRLLPLGDRPAWSSPPDRPPMTAALRAAPAQASAVAAPTVTPTGPSSHPGSTSAAAPGPSTGPGTPADPVVPGVVGLGLAGLLVRLRRC